MIDERFVATSHRFDPPPDAFERLRRRRDRKRRNRRITAGVVGIVLFVAAVWIVRDVTSLNRTQKPAIQPAQTPTIQPTPSPELEVPAPVTAPWFDRNEEKMMCLDPNDVLYHAGAWCGEDYLLDLKTGEMTPLPLPDSIVATQSVGVGQNGYSISPDGSEIAYYGPAEDGSRQVEVFVAGPDGTHIQQITHGEVGSQGEVGGWVEPGSPLLQPGWSPDGRKIAYAGRPDGDQNFNIFVVDLTSGETTQVTFETLGVQSSAQFTPDGSSIVYTADTADGHQVRIVSVAGDEASTLLGGSGTEANNAVISPDGSLVAYSCYRGPDSWELSADLCLANTDGTGSRVLVPGRSSYGISSASWSPDGSRLAYWTFHLWDVYVVDVATGQSMLVGKGAWPSWLDDNTLIVEIYNGGA